MKSPLSKSGLDISDRFLLLFLSWVWPGYLFGWFLLGCELSCTVTVYQGKYKCVENSAELKQLRTPLLTKMVAIRTSPFEHSRHFFSTCIFFLYYLFCYRSCCTLPSWFDFKGIQRIMTCLQSWQKPFFFHLPELTAHYPGLLIFNKVNGEQKTGNQYTLTGRSALTCVQFFDHPMLLDHCASYPLMSTVGNFDELANRSTHRSH